MNLPLSNWNIGKVLSIKRANKGAVNDNWIIQTDKGKYILRKLNREYQTKELEFEIKYLNSLKREGFNYLTPCPIKTKDNQEFIKIKREIFWLYEFIKGKHRKDSSNRTLSEIAKMLSLFHSLLEKLELDNHKPPPKEFGRKGILKEMREFLEKLGKRKNKRDLIFSRESKRVINTLNSLNTKTYDALPKYPIHRDLNPENLLWKKDKLIGIIDFENVGRINDTFIRDIAIILQYFCTNKEKSFNTERAIFFIKEYKKYRNLSDKEIESLIDTLIATNIEDFGYAYWLLVNTPERAKLKHLRKYSKMAEYLFKNKTLITKELLNPVIL